MESTQIRPYKKLRGLLREQWFFILIVIVLISTVTGLVNNNFFKPANLISILEQISTLGLVATGATIVMISGNIDISVASSIGLGTCCMAMLMQVNVPEWQAVLVGIAVTTLCGMFVGGVSIALKAPSFIVSLACVGMFKGISLALTNASVQTIYGKFEWIGKTKVFDTIPMLFVFSLLGYGIMAVILNKTKFGRRVYALGNNEQAAYLSGIKVKQNKLLIFAVNGFLVGCAAALLLSRVGAVQPSTGTGMDMKAIGAVVIGGVPMKGGKGRILGTFFGVLLMGIISNCLNMLQVSPYAQDIVQGLIIIAALAVSLLSQKNSGKQ